jgi:hypothetical protein
MAEPVREVYWVASGREFKYVGAATDQESRDVAARASVCLQSTSS